MMPINTVNDISPRIQGTAAAGQTAFFFPFEFYADTDLSVYLAASLTTPPNDASTTFGGLKLILNVDYTVIGAGLDTPNPSRQINLTAASFPTGAALGNIVTIVRNMPEDRLNFYIPGGPFTANAVNTDFVKQTMMNQQNEMTDTLLSPNYRQSTYNVLLKDLELPILAANQAWVMNSANTQIIASNIVAGQPGPPGPPGPAGSANVTLPVVQVAHGLVVGNVVRIDGVGNFIKAQANNVANAEVVGIVTTFTDANNFTLTIAGSIVAGLAGLLFGEVQYLSPTTPGAMVNVRPVAVGQVVKPLLVALTATSGIWNNMLGELL